ncbi:MAG: DUF3830 family protein [Alicyclobacillus sp.]|nr:DUF3830 family protein [Alicyclobacillus sp.]
MGQRFILRLGGEQVVAELMEEKAPNISRTFLQHLPVESFSVHAKFAGQELIVMVPFYAEPENEVFHVQPGDIGYYPGRQTICIFYGDTRPFGHVSVFARVVDGLERLHAVGQTVLDRGFVPAYLAAQADQGASGGPKQAAGIRMDIVPEPLRDALRRAWHQEPDDIRRLRQVMRPPMGNLPCVLYANFNTFWAGEGIQVYRQLAVEQSLPLEALNRAVSAILRRHAARLAKWDLRETVDLVSAVADYFGNQGPRSYAEFIEVSESFLLCINRFNSWIDAIIPWSAMDPALALRPAWNESLAQAEPANPETTGGDVYVRDHRPVV